MTRCGRSQTPAGRAPGMACTREAGHGGPCAMDYVGPATGLARPRRDFQARPAVTPGPAGLARPRRLQVELWRPIQWTSDDVTAEARLGPLRASLGFRAFGRWRRLPVRVPVRWWVVTVLGIDPARTDWKGDWT